MAETVIAIVVLALICGGAIAYIIKAKKSGRKCIGCPDGASCSKTGCTSCSSCTSCLSCTSCSSCCGDKKE